MNDRDEKIIELASTHNMSEIAEILGISRERVRQILNRNGVTERQFVRSTKIELIEKIIPLLGTMPDSDIARKFGISHNAVGVIRKERNIEKFMLPIGCNECKKNPYAVGLCRNCYTRDNIKKNKKKKEAEHER